MVAFRIAQETIRRHFNGSYAGQILVRDDTKPNSYALYAYMTDGAGKVDCAFELENGCWQLSSKLVSEIKNEFESLIREKGESFRLIRERNVGVIRKRQSEIQQHLKMAQAKPARVRTKRNIAYLKASALLMETAKICKV